MISWLWNFTLCALMCIVLGTPTHSEQNRPPQPRVTQQPRVNTAMARGLANYIFDSADASEDGFLDIHELWSIFAAHDVNKDSRIELGEYVSSMRSESNSQMAALRHLEVKMFVAADFNQDRTLSMDDAVAILATLDSNRDGKISKDEFTPRWSALLIRIASPHQ